MIVLLVGQFAVGELLLKLGARVDRRLGALGREGEHDVIIGRGDGDGDGGNGGVVLVMAMAVVLVW